MINYETFMRIKSLQRLHGLSAAQIAGKLGLDGRTVEKWLHQDHYRQRRPVHKASKLDPYKEMIKGWLELYPYSAKQVFQRLVEEGFTGGYTIVKDYVRLVRPPRSRAYLTLSFAPGECAQVDWGSWGTVAVGATRRRLSFFVMVLCHSRLMYVEFTVSQTMEHFLACHQHAFERWGCVPAKIMVDNLRSAVLKRAVGQEPVLNPRYLDFANHYGFTIVPCGVGKGNEKGRVENAVGYVKKNFLAGLDILDFKHLNPAAVQWMDTVANVRVHGETGKKPLELFEEERAHLSPLPANPYDTAAISTVRVSSQFRVSLDTNRYSVPAEYAGCQLTLKAYADRLCIYHQEKLIGRHVRSYERRKDFEHPDHPKALLAQRRKAREHKIFIRFLALSPHAEAYYRQLAQRRLNPLHHMRQIVALSEIHGTEAIAHAMEDAFAFQAFSCEYIANLLEQRSRHRPSPGALHLTRRSDLLELNVKRPDMSVYDHLAATEKEEGNGNN